MKSQTSLLLLILNLFTINTLIAQNEPNKQGLLKRIQSKLPDSTTVEAFLKYGELYENSDPDSALFYFNKAIEVSRKIDYPKGEAYTSSYLLPIYNNRGLFKEGLKIALEALEIYKKVGNNKDLSSGYINVGSEWEYFSEYKLAADYYLRALPYATKAKHDRNLRIINNNLASVYINIGDYEKGKKYATEALKIATKIKNEYAEASSLINIASAKNYLKDYKSALIDFEQVEKLGKKMNDSIIIIDGLLGKGDTYFYLKNYVLAKKYFQNSFIISKSIEAPDYELMSILGIGRVLKEEKKFAEAYESFNKGVEIAKKLGTKNELQSALFECATMQENLKNNEKALTYYKEASAWKDSLFKENNLLQVSVLDVKYETAKKEEQIKLQEAQIKQNRLLNYLFGGIAVITLILSVVGYRNYQHNQKIQKLEIVKLQNEKQLTATESIIKGQEEERSRLAKDLHDGLGGILSSLKYSLTSMTGNFVLNESNGKLFTKALETLETAISEMRRVAHSMMPEALLKFGLKDAIINFCEGINQHGKLQINFQAYGLDNRLEQSVEITIFRIVQELLNNAMKHSEATKVLVQLTKTNETLVLTVEDNGKGFDKKLLEQNKGAGISNIESRVSYLNGQIEIDSNSATGTSIIIEIPIKKV